MTKLLLFVGALLVGSLLIPCAFWIADYFPAGSQAEYDTQWRWSKEKASLEYCIKKHLPDYDVELVRKNAFNTPLEIRAKNDRKVIYDMESAHPSTVLTRSKDMLYIADFSYGASGCSVIALDLKSGKQLWKSRLKAIGPTNHKEYVNLVNIETDGKQVIVNGNEAYARYVEVLDIKTGKTLANTKLKPDIESLTR